MLWTLNAGNAALGENEKRHPATRDESVRIGLTIGMHTRMEATKREPPESQLTF